MSVIGKKNFETVVDYTTHSTLGVGNEQQQNISFVHVGIYDHTSVIRRRN